MKKIIFVLFILTLLSAGCGTQAAVNDSHETPVETAPVQATETAAPAVKEEVFDPSVITKEVYDTTKIDVQHYIEELNGIIKSRNYKAWRANLSDEYFMEISSDENLQQISELPAMKNRRIVLKTAEDYFINVVVPSRANSRVDDIEFIGINRVKAYTLNTSRTGEEQRLRLYELEQTGNTWKIIN